MKSSDLALSDVVERINKGKSEAGNLNQKEAMLMDREFYKEILDLGKTDLHNENRAIDEKIACGKEAMKSETRENQHTN